ncbi:hypothetical protein NQZ68_020598 [Dissostichus eleginoides]|nr:hypothetical protein NQZ68_020598 [Dissostichus eleginoides]
MPEQLMGQEEMLIAGLYNRGRGGMNEVHTCEDLLNCRGKAGLVKREEEEEEEEE